MNWCKCGARIADDERYCTDCEPDGWRSESLSKWIDGIVKDSKRKTERPACSVCDRPGNRYRIGIADDSFTYGHDWETHVVLCRKCAADVAKKLEPIMTELTGEPCKATRTGRLLLRGDIT